MYIHKNLKPKPGYVCTYPADNIFTLGITANMYIAHLKGEDTHVTTNLKIANMYTAHLK